MIPQVYKFICTNGVYRPFIPIRITNPDFKSDSIQIHALLDTGADACVFPKFVADATKHDLKGDSVESEITQGVGEGHISVWKHTFVIELLSPDLKTVIWKSKNSLIRCVDHDNVPALLGFEHFMSNFKVSFNFSSKTVTIQKPLI